ncbi:MAG: GNAT family N-acetyltransferase [Phycisphaeraceae bacterium]|nr:GNAT family N-acetyltransferase [Phycisphaeraceae bacterium]
MAYAQANWKTEPIAADDPRPAHEAVRQLMRLAESSGSDKTRLWATVTNRGRLSAAVLVIPQPGGNGMVLATPPAGRGAVMRLTHLLNDCCQSLDTRQIQMVQMLADPSQKRVREALVRAGFWRLARLCYLQAAIGHKPQKDLMPEGSRCLSYREDRRELFLEALSDSYQGTMDCPKLHGLRSTEQALQAHRSTGPFDPKFWNVLQIGGRTAGVILLNPIRSVHAMELVYLGLGPRYRGHGLGGRLLRYGLQQAAAAGHHTMVLAVDEANTPAVRLYKQMGFSRTDIKDAFVRHLPTSGATRSDLST